MKRGHQSNIFKTSPVPSHHQCQWNEALLMWLLRSSHLRSERSSFSSSFMGSRAGMHSLHQLRWDGFQTSWPLSPINAGNNYPGTCIWAIMRVYLAFSICKPQCAGKTWGDNRSHFSLHWKEFRHCFKTTNITTNTFQAFRVLKSWNLSISET